MIGAVCQRPAAYRPHDRQLATVEMAFEGDGLNSLVTARCDRTPTPEALRVG